ncbi:MAG: DUF3095 family protein [Rhodoplanes sp.]
MMCCGWYLTARRSSDAPSRRSSPPRTGEATSSMALHPSASALITCLLFGLKDSRHLHFIDGTDGGFTFAARAMKAQVAATCVDASTVHRGGPSSM